MPTDDVVRLREWRTDDAPAVVVACNDPLNQRWLAALPSPYTDEHALEYIRECLDAGEDRHAFAIADATTDELLGAIDVSVNRFGVGHVGYWVAPHARGRGVCTRALRLLTRWTLDELGLGRVELMTDPENHASQRVAEKAGFTREGRLRSALAYRDGRRVDAFMFSAVPEDFA
jgi:RimJ/RimL family protein N-acetyltransferase